MRTKVVASAAALSIFACVEAQASISVGSAYSPGGSSEPRVSISGPLGSVNRTISFTPTPLDFTFGVDVTNPTQHQQTSVSIRTSWSDSFLEMNVETSVRYGMGIAWDFIDFYVGIDPVFGYRFHIDQAQLYQMNSRITGWAGPSGEASTAIYSLATGQQIHYVAFSGSREDEALLQPGDYTMQIRGQTGFVHQAAFGAWLGGSSDLGVSIRIQAVPSPSVLFVLPTTWAFAVGRRRRN